MIPPRKKKLPPYGDIDRDGAPNWSDCDPYDPDEQGIFKRAVGVLTKDKYGQTKEEYEQEKYEKAIRKAQLAELEAQAATSGQPLQKTGPAQSARRWAERQAERDFKVPSRAKGALSRIATPVERTVSPYVTGEQWPEPPIARRRPPPQEEIGPQRVGPRYRYQPGGPYANRKGYCSVPPGREPIINIFRDSRKIKPVNMFKRRIR